MEKVEQVHEELGGGVDEKVLATGVREARSYDPKFMQRTRYKTDMILLPLMVAIYLTSSLDKSNLGNAVAKSLGMIKDIGGDPEGSKYAFLVSLYFIGYAPLMVPFALIAKRTKMKNFMTIGAIIWGVAATCFAAVTNFSGAYACRFIIGLGEAAFVPVFLVFLSRFYTRQALGTRMAIWLTMAPFGGFCNGILAYAFSYVRGGPLQSWRALFLCEGLLTFVVGVAGFLILPNDIRTCRWFTAEEKEFYYGVENSAINWQHARGVFVRWQQLLPVLMYMCQQITGAALSAFLPSLMTDLGFSGANAQLATLGPYGAAMVGMVLASRLSDRYKNRGWPCQVGWAMCVVAFAIYLGCDPKNSPARFVALVLAEVGHYICTPLIIVWGSNNAGNESRRAVVLPLANSLAQAIAIGAGYLFPASDAPKYTMGSAAELGLSVLGGLATAAYQILIWRENRRRNADEGGKPDSELQPDVDTYADDAPGFRYIM